MACQSPAEAVAVADPAGAKDGDVKAAFSSSSSSCTSGSPFCDVLESSLCSSPSVSASESGSAGWETEVSLASSVALAVSLDSSDCAGLDREADEGSEGTGRDELEGESGMVVMVSVQARWGRAIIWSPRGPIARGQHLPTTFLFPLSRPPPTNNTPLVPNHTICTFARYSVRKPTAPFNYLAIVLTIAAHRRRV